MNTLRAHHRCPHHPQVTLVFSGYNRQLNATRFLCSLCATPREFSSGVVKHVNHDRGFLLFNNVYAMANLVGFDPYQGFYHADHFGHPALVSDLMEEFRTIVVDSAALWVLNKGLVTWADFTEQKDGLSLKPEALKKFLKHYEDRMQTRIFHPGANGRVTYLHALELQARLLARVLRQEAQEYRSFTAE